MDHMDEETKSFLNSLSQPEAVVARPRFRMPAPTDPVGDPQSQDSANEVEEPEREGSDEINLQGSDTLAAHEQRKK